MSVSNQHRHSTGSDMTQHQHQDSPAQPPSQQSGQSSGSPHTPVGYPPSNHFPPPRTPLAQRGSSPSKQVPMGMAMTVSNQVKTASPTNVPVSSARPDGKPVSTRSAPPTIAVFACAIRRITWHAGIALPAALCCPAGVTFHLGPSALPAFDVLSDLIAAGSGSNDDAYLLVVNEADIH
ncbi:hypothetical protein AAVH_08480 [Aphelenchoides avenae]|nr:hypothetical protein AAVH_08480 [Aphelenchus avenae]